MGHHINDEGQFQSDKYPDLPPDKIILSFRDDAAFKPLLDYAAATDDEELGDDIVSRLMDILTEDDDDEQSELGERRTVARMIDDDDIYLRLEKAWAKYYANHPSDRTADRRAVALGLAIKFHATESEGASQTVHGEVITASDRVLNTADKFLEWLVGLGVRVEETGDG